MYYERLTALDSSFLDIEDVSVHMHVAAVLLFEPGPLARDDGGLDMERIRAYIGSRLHMIPRYRQRLAYTPIERHPVWVDDDRFNLFYHVRHTSLPRPGSERQLKRLCGRLMSQKLDATKPLWEIWVIEGLADGRFALVAKVHHCMVDGISGVDLLTVLLSPSPDDTIQEPPECRPRRAPTARELLGAEVWRRASMPLDVLRAARSAFADRDATVEAVRTRVDGLLEVVRGASTPASDTILNPSRIGPHRRFDWIRLDLGEVKRIKERLGGTVNDVVLATVTGATRRFLSSHGQAPEDLNFRAMIPVSIRTSSERGALGNRVSQMLAALPLDEANPARRLQRVVETTQRLKHSHQVEASELIEELSDWTATAVLTQMIRFAAARRAYNLVVTNVPGPPLSLYLLGARLRESYPMVPLFANQGLGIALFSYDGGLYWGINADWDALPDLHDYVDALGAGFAELSKAARDRAASAARSRKARPVRRKTARRRA
jgi:WS/DGAT/MGAT family acyltransferase